MCFYGVEKETAEETENFHQFSQQYEKWKVKKLDKILINVESRVKVKKTQEGTQKKRSEKFFNFPIEINLILHAERMLIFLLGIF